MALKKYLRCFTSKKLSKFNYTIINVTTGLRFLVNRLGHYTQSLLITHWGHSLVTAAQETRRKAELEMY